MRTSLEALEEATHAYIFLPPNTAPVSIALIHIASSYMRWLGRTMYPPVFTTVGIVRWLSWIETSIEKVDVRSLKHICHSSHGRVLREACNLNFDLEFAPF